MLMITSKQWKVQVSLLLEPSKKKLQAKVKPKSLFKN